MKPVLQPNVPQGPVTLVAVAGNAMEVISTLRQQGRQVVPAKAVDTVPEPVACHADLQLLHLGGSKLLLAAEATGLQPQLKEFGFSTSILEHHLGNIYPNDISLNFLIQKNHCFGMCSNMPLQVKNYCVYAGLQPVAVKQGYARCSVAVVSANAAITADTGLYNAMTAIGIDVLLIGAGDILLSGYDTGFIGGCCGLLDRDKLAFAGNLDCYQFGDSIKLFLKKHNVTPVMLHGGKLTDIGGILPLAVAE